jgi:CheY-like chemotaxis protein
MEQVDIARNRSKIIFGVDDNATNLAFLQATLTSAGYIFVGFSGGLPCLSAVFRAPPRLILLDIQMPGIDGFEVCRRLRLVPEGRAIPVAFLTGLKTREDVRAGIAAGGNDFIIKPIDRTRLLERVQHWSNRRIDPTNSRALNTAMTAEPTTSL